MRIYTVLLLVLVAGCAHLGREATDVARAELWDQAHQALASTEFERATELFQRLSREFPNTEEARESLFYLGAIRLDPRNPGWDPAPAEAALNTYLRNYPNTGGEAAPAGSRVPEARILFQLARQLNMPAAQRVPALQPETRVVRERVVVPAAESRALAEEVEQLRRTLAARDSTIAQQQAELERIRNTLVPRG